MNATSQERIQELISIQRKFFASRQTRDYAFRKKQLKGLKQAILRYEDKIAEALFIDLHKSYPEAYLSEISLVLQEIDLHLKNLRRWMEPRKVSTPWYLWPSGSQVISEPLGVSLIMAPWNYPFMLLMTPLVGAISAGCTALLKPSPYAEQTAQIMHELIEDTFDPGFVSMVQGGRQTNQQLFQEHFDFIFFTGSSDVGKVVMAAAAKFLTPVVLELGGKSPCIVDEGANLKLAARRIAWGKTINAGQSCIAPDYLLVHEDIKDQLIPLISQATERLFGSDLKKSPNYPRIINQKAFNRITGLMNAGAIAYGGDVDPAERYIQLTILDDVKQEDPIMHEEIFGPLLPVLTYRHISEAIAFVDEREKPLALYYFGKNIRAREVIRQTSSGGTSINDTMVHIANHRMPFGGVGNSGMGKYHGIDSFRVFSNERSCVRAARRVDLPFRYPPFKGFKWLRRFL